MAMNPALIMKLMNARKQFEERHPRVLSFMEHELMTEIPDGTILEVSVTKPGRNKVTTNMRVTAEDLQLLKDLQELQKK